MERTVSGEYQHSSSIAAISFPTQAFGAGTISYRAFLEALAEGFAEYEELHLQGGERGNASTPLPAA